MKITLNHLALAVAVAMSAFAGVLATLGLATFVPGAQAAVFIMGALFEIGQLVAFSWLHRHWSVMNVGLRYGLACLALIVVVLDVLGVSGQLSNSYQGRKNSGQIATEQSFAKVDAQIEQAQGELDDNTHQLALAEEQIGKANEAQLKARDNKDRIKAAKAALTEAYLQRTSLESKRNAITSKLSGLKVERSQVKGQQIAAAGEFAAVQFAAATFGVSEDVVARIVIMVISSLPNLFAMALIMAAGTQHASSKTAAKVLTTKQVASRKGWETRRRKAREAAFKRGPQVVKS
jgi:hypothetical protein